MIYIANDFYCLTAKAIASAASYGVKQNVYVNLVV